MYFFLPSFPLENINLVQTSASQRKTFFPRFRKWMNEWPLRARLIYILYIYIYIYIYIYYIHIQFFHSLDLDGGYTD